MKAPILFAVSFAIAVLGAGIGHTQQSDTTANKPDGPPQSGSDSGSAGSWYAIAMSSTSQAAAQQRANQLGGSWFVMSTNQCPNFTRNFWVAVVGPFSHGDALAHVGSARQSGVNDAYAKSCY